MGFKKIMNLRLIQDEESYDNVLLGNSGYLLISGESGFEYYLTYPTAEIRTSLKVISLLMHDLESLSWYGRLYNGNLDDISTASYEANIEWGELKLGDHLEKGEITTGLWLSPTLSKFGIAETVLDVLRGEAPRIIMNL